MTTGAPAEMKVGEVVEMARRIHLITLLMNHQGLSIMKLLHINLNSP